jgi:hypothetical protein
LKSKIRVLANWGQTEALYRHTKVAELIHETLQRAKHLPLDASTRCAVGAFGRVYQAAQAARLAPIDGNVSTPVPTLYVPNLFPQQLK